MLMKLKEARMRAEMKQVDVAALLGKNQTHYGKIERAEVSLSAHDALILCRQFGLSLEELLEKS